MSRPVFALVDCNSFYASCQQLFSPALRARPVVVLSNNDGAVVARSKEAKALGVPMGVPWFKIRDWARPAGVIAVSSCYELYADMSNRVVEVLRQFTPDLEVYSIDEAFLRLDPLHPALVGSNTAYGQQMRTRVAQWVGMPVCVGIGPTKTLSKLANHLAKKNDPFNGVCDWLAFTATEQDDWMASTAVEEVWGVGRHIGARLQAIGVHTVLDLKRADPTMIRREFSVVLQRTVYELRGVSCIPLETMAAAKQQIMCSRSFGEPVHDLDQLREAVSSYVFRAAEKLRRQESVTGGILVGIYTNWFRKDLPQYAKSMLVPMALATDDSRVLAGHALAVLDAIYRPGYAYKKAAVMLTELQPKSGRQNDLWAGAGCEQGARGSERLMVALDAVNGRFGRGSLQIASMGTDPTWTMRRARMSPRFTTRWEDLPRALAC